MMNDSKIYSDEVFDLRLALNRGENDEGNQLLINLHTFRKRYQDIIKIDVSYNQEDPRTVQMSNLFQELWGFLSKLDGDKPEEKILKLPPIYHSNSLKNLLSQFIPRLLARERLSFCNSSTYFLHGLKGTGKTTILKALLLAVNICSPNFFFIYHDFVNDGDTTLSELGMTLWNKLNNALPANKRYQLPERNEKTILGKIFVQIYDHFRLCTAIMLDGIHHLFTNGASKREMLFPFSIFMKQTGSMLFLAGSVADLYSRLVKDVRSYFKIWSCNWQLIEPFRSVEVLNSYMITRYSVNLSDENLSALLFYTGGIGSAIHNLAIKNHLEAEQVRVNTHENLEIAKNEILYCVPMESLIVIADMTRLNLHSTESIIDNPLTIREIPGVKKDALYSPYHSVERKHSEILIQLSDHGLLYLDDSDLFGRVMVHIAVPAILQLILQDNSCQELSRITSSLKMIYYQESGVRAEIAFEDFLLPRMHFITDGALKQWENDCVMQLNDSVIRFTAKDKDYSPLELPFNQLISWRNETGIVGLQFISDFSKTVSSSSSKRIVFVDFWQCRSGYWKNEYTGGARNLRIKYLVSRDVNHFKKNQISGILVRAEVGMLHCLRYLSKHFGAQYDFQIRNLFLTFTSELSRTAVAAVHQRKRTIPETLVKEILTDAGTKLCKYKLRFYGLPLTWLEDSVKGTPLLYDFVVNSKDYFSGMEDNSHSTVETPRELLQPPEKKMKHNNVNKQTEK
jgi:hypothetical protein